MFLQKQKKILQVAGARLGRKLVLLHVLRLGEMVILGVIALSIAIYAQPAAKPTHKINSHKAANKTSITRHAAPPKTLQPVAVAPQPVTAPPPSSPPPTPAKPPTPTAGTPKPEPVVTPSPASSVSGLTPTASPPAPSSPTPPPSSQTATGYLSTNWSGYLAANGTFTTVSASWTATMATGNGSTTSADSSWIGIGGVTSGDLIQVGTQNTVTAGGQVSTSAFYELLPDASQPVPGVTVAEGDSMAASITEISSGQWTVTITDNTDKQSWTATVSYASSLSSAEWIEEDPSYVSGQLVPFDNFHEAIFTGGLTTQNGASVNIVASTAQPVTMVDSNGQPIAVPSAIGSDGASFTVSP